MIHEWFILDYILRNSQFYSSASCSRSMDAEELIREVFIRESLWNQAHPDHHNRFILEKQWEEIGKNMNATSK